MSLRVFLLGRFEVERDGTAVPKEAWRRRRPADLLKRIALAPGRSLAREQLIEELWPDKDPETGANNLHRALHDLRQVLGGKFVAPDKGVIRMAPDVWIDVVAFEEEAARGDPAALANAVDYYRGDLCPDDPYGDLLETFRRAFKLRFLDVALRLARHLAAAGDDTKTIDVLRRVLTVDTAQEEAHCSLMQALARIGRRAEAIAQFEACAEALRLLGSAPSARTVAAHRAITSAKPAAPAAAAAPDAAWMRLSRRLLGTTELSALRGRDGQLLALGEPNVGVTGSLWLVGEAGVGKTRLAYEAARLAVEHGVTVMSGVCLGDDAANVPYAPFLEMWAEHLRARGEPTANNPFFAVAKDKGNAEASGEQHVDQLRLFEAVHRAFEMLATPAPPLVILDDLQFADASTLELCQYLVRTSRTRPMRFVFTCRSDGLVAGAPVHKAFTALLKQRLARRLVIERLGEEDTRALIADVLHGPPAETLARAVYELTGGNAFYTEEVARSVGDGGDASDLVSDDLAEMVRERVARLGADAESLLVAASAMGQRFAFDVAAIVAGVATPEALEALERALAAHLVEEVEGAYVFRHRLVRESLYRALSRARRAHLHTRTAEALEAQGGAHHEQLAWHWREAGVPARAFKHVVAAADRVAERAGLREAVRLYEDALVMAASLPANEATLGPDRFGLLVKLGKARTALTEIDQSLARFDEALALGIDGGYRPDTRERARARLGAGLSLMVGGRLAAAGDRLDAAMRELEAGGSTPEIAAYFHHLALLRWNEGRFADALSCANRSLEEAERLADVRAQARAHEALVIAHHAAGDWPAAMAHATKRHALVGPTLDVAELFDTHLAFWELHLHDGAGRLQTRQLLETTERAARTLGAQRIVALCRCVGGTLELFAGNSALAEARLREAYALYRAVGVPSGQAACLHRLALALLASERIDEARSAIADGIFVAQTSPMRAHVLIRLHAVLARIEVESGELDAAREAIRAAEQIEAADGKCMTCTLDVEQERVRLEVAAGQLHLAEQSATRLEEAARSGHPASRALAHLARARVSAARDDARTAYRAASAAWLEAGSPADAAASDREAEAR